MNLENNQPVKSDENQEHSTKVDNSRRSFAKKSAAIAPVILTLANRSAWGGEFCVVTQSVTGVASYTPLSSHTKATRNSNWVTPSGWKSWRDSQAPGTRYPGLTGRQSNSAYAAFSTNSSSLDSYRWASLINSYLPGGFPAMFLAGGDFYNNRDAYIKFYDSCSVSTPPQTI